MNSKFLVLSSLFLLGGCATNMQVAKTDMPEDDTYTVAAPPATSQPTARGIASVEQAEEVGRNPASDDDTSETMAAPGSNNTPTDISARARTHDSEKKCNTLAFVKGVLSAHYIEFPERTGDAKDSGASWLRAKFSQLPRFTKPKDLDICVYDGGNAGTIVVRSDGQWQDGCGTDQKRIPQYNGRHFLACYRPPASKKH